MKKFIKSSVKPVILLLVITGCRLNSAEIDQVLIRIENSSSYDMNMTKANFPEEEITYGRILSGRKSSFNEVEKAYRYAYIETTVNDIKLVLQPVDYVGESLLEPGLYTYRLSIDEEIFNSDNPENALSLQLIPE